MSTLKVDGIRSNSATSDAITLASDGTCTANITNNLSNRNKVINGAVLINQRGNATGVNSSGYYGPDRFKWIQNSSSAAFSINQSTESPDGFATSYHVDCTTADTSVAADSYVRFLTALEGKDVQDFAKGTSSAKKAVLSFYVKTNKTGTYSVLYFDSDNNRQFTATYTVSNTNWNRYTIPVPADTTGAFYNDTGASLEIYWGLVAGSNLTGSVDGAWQSYTQSKEMAGHNVNFADSTSNNFYITGIQLEVDTTGSGVATDFEHRSFAVEKRLCMRYFQKYFNLPAHGYVPDNGSRSYSHGFVFPVQMRTTPSTTLSNTGSVAGQYISDGQNTVNVSALNATGHTPELAELYFNLSGDLTNYRGAYLISTSSTSRQTTYSFNAEL